MRFAARLLTFVWLSALLFPTAALAQVPYDTWFVDRQDGDLSIIQPIYLPKQVIDGNRLDKPFSSPNDLFIAESGHVFIADTDNDRIVELTDRGDFVRSFGSEEGPGKLTKPEGVFVAPDGTVYVANTGGRSIVKYDGQGRFQQAFGKPESELLFEDYHFLPSKLVVDRRGVIYVVVKNTYQGLMRLNAQGEFTGFFGANKTKLTFMDRLRRMILSKEQLAKEAPKRPNAIENVSLTDDGFLLVTSSGEVSDGQIRKLNAGGSDAFHNRAFDPQLVDTVMDANGFLYSFSRSLGEIGIYDPSGSPLAYFGTGDKVARQQGVTGFPTAIEVSASQEIWLLDSAQNLVQVFGRTGFGDTFLKANKLFFQGNYEASRPYWEQVKALNGMMDISLSGLGKYAMSQGDYPEAVRYFKDAKDAAGYSDAFWYVRYEWIQRNFVVLLIVVAALLWGLSFLFRRRKAILSRWNAPPWLKRYGTELRDGLYAMFHPYEGFYRMKERKISLVVVALIVATAIAANLYSVFGASLLVHPYDIAKVNIPYTVGFLIVPWATWVIANYLVSAVKGGEGRFREVLQASSFALLPYIALTVAGTAVSNVIVYPEWVVFELIQKIMWIWIAVMLFVLTQVTHNFDFMETGKNIAVTLFTIGVIWIFAGIMMALGANLYEFIQQIFREVSFVA